MNIKINLTLYIDNIQSSEYHECDEAEEKYKQSVRYKCEPPRSGEPC